MLTIQEQRVWGTEKTVYVYVASWWDEYGIRHINLATCPLLAARDLLRTMCWLKHGRPLT